MSRFDGNVRSLSCSRSLNDVSIRLVLVCMVGQTPLMPSSPVHCPPSVWLCSKIVGSNPCDSSQRAVTRPPGPAPITATRSVMSRTVAYASIRLNDVPETSYAPCGDLSLAYQVFGDGPVELVWAGSFASHVELYWSMPEFASLMERLGTFCRILLFDKAGGGLSDPVPQIRTLDERATEIQAGMDAARFGRAAILGVSEGGPAAILFAATRPERTRALILTGASAYSGWISWDDFERDPAELRARSVAEFDEKYVPSLKQVAGF